MKKIFLSFRYIMTLPILGLLLSSIATVVVGAKKTWSLFDLVFSSGSLKPEITAKILSVIDLYLIATVQVVAMFGLTALFFGFTPKEKAFKITSLTELKVVLSELIVLVIAIRFVEILLSGEEGTKLFWTSLSITLVGLMLVVFSVFTGRHTGTEQAGTH